MQNDDVTDLHANAQNDDIINSSVHVSRRYNLHLCITMLITSVDIFSNVSYDRLLCMHNSLQPALYALIVYAVYVCSVCMLCFVCTVLYVRYCTNTLHTQYCMLTVIYGTRENTSVLDNILYMALHANKHASRNC